MSRNYGAAMRSLLLTSVSICCVPTIAYAQDASSAPETVVVTGSLISRPGFEAPTPVTSVTATDLNQGAKNTLADTLNQLPQFGAPTTSDTGFNGQSAGANYINLRNLGSTRTLVLLNGERVVASSLTNSVDLNTLPSSLLQRVDVVTGGASASYGSDAVAGVVNLIVNTNFQGLKADAQYSNNTLNAYEGYRADIDYGTSFDGDRGHIVASFSYFDNPQFYLIGQAPWNNNTALVLNPAYTATNGQPQLVHANGTAVSVATVGGVIFGGPLNDTQFVGPTAQPVHFNPGNVSGNICNACDGDTNWLDKSPIAQPQNGYNFYTYAS
jgi:iron complex outermembrane receptor protein